MLLLTHIFAVHAAVAGIVFLAVKRDKALVLCKFFCVACVLAQIGWLIEAGWTIPYCALLDPWGVMAVVIITGIIASWRASIRYQSPRVLIGGLVLVGMAVGIGRLLLPEPGSSSVTMGWTLAFHILLVSLGYSILAVGCVTGLLILLRSRLLKSTRWAIGSEIPWPSLTALDRLFVRSIGVGILLLTAGIVLGIAAFPDSSLDGPWYGDPKVLLTLASFILYGIVWWLRRRQGFCTPSVAGLSTLGFILIFAGILVSGLFEKGFHKF